MKLTLLEIVQNILSDMDSDNVNSIDDTVESQQVALIVKDCFMNLTSNRNWHDQQTLFQLKSLADVTRPNYMAAPEGLKELIKRISQNKVEKVVVLYKDRLLRFGFELVEYIASLYNCDIEIIDNTEKSEQQELVEDLVQIITVFSCKLQGKRANKARKLVKELIEEGGEDNGKNDSSNASSKQ